MTFLQVWMLAPQIFPAVLKCISISFPCIRSGGKILTSKRIYNNTFLTEKWKLIA